MSKLQLESITVPHEKQGDLLALGESCRVGEGVHGDLVVFAAAWAGALPAVDFAGVGVTAGPAGSKNRSDGSCIDGGVGIEAGN